MSDFITMVKKHFKSIEKALPQELAKEKIKTFIEDETAKDILESFGVLLSKRPEIPNENKTTFFLKHHTGNIVQLHITFNDTDLFYTEKHSIKTVLEKTKNIILFKENFEKKINTYFPAMVIDYLSKNQSLETLHVEKFIKKPSFEFIRHKKRFLLEIPTKINQEERNFIELKHHRQIFKKLYRNQFYKSHKKLYKIETILTKNQNKIFIVKQKMDEERLEFKNSIKNHHDFFKHIKNYKNSLLKLQFPKP